MAKLPPPKREAILNQLTDREVDELLHDWRFWARPEQMAPPREKPWLVWLYLAGRGSGKTRSGAEWVRQKVKEGSGRIALIAPTAADARDVMVEGVSGILSCSWQHDRTVNGAAMGLPTYEPSKRRLTWGNGAIATCFSAEEPDRLRGPQHNALWGDELAAWSSLQDTWDMAMFGLRLGQNPQAMVTTTPKPLAMIRQMLADPRNVNTRGSTWDNRAHLARSFFDQIVSKYDGTRLGRQELYGELIEDIEGALWTVGILDQFRVMDTSLLPDFVRVVVAVDPSGASGPDDKRSDEIGISVVGLGTDGIAYVLEDLSGRMGPDQWGATAVSAYHRHQASCIAAEVNFGGAMVRQVIKTVDAFVPYQEVRATRGKAVRAEPIANLFHTGKMRLVGRFPRLEEQLVNMTTAGYMGDRSADRLDAMCWSGHVLFPALTKVKREIVLPPPIVTPDAGPQSWLLR